MALLTSSFCLFFIIIAYLLDRRLYNPFILFNAWWGISLLLSSMGLFGIYIPEESTYLIMLSVIFFFNFSLIFLSIKRKDHYKQLDFQSDNKLLDKVLLLFQTFVLIILVIRSIKVLELLISGLNYSSVRYHYFKLDTIMTGYDFLINDIFVSPILTFSMIYISLRFFEKKYNKFLILTTFICLLLQVFSSGGRSIIITFGIIFMASYLVNKKNFKKLKVSKKLFLSFLIFTVFSSLIFVTLQRLEKESGIISVVEMVVRYFSAPYIYFEKMIPFVENDKIYLYGGAFFGGILDIPIFVVRALGFDIAPMSSYISTYNQMYITVNNHGDIYNAFPTMAYTFYYDFGFLGIIIGSVLFGLFSLISYKKMIQTNNLKYKGIYVLVTITIFESIMRWEGMFMSTWIVILLFILVGFSQKSRLLKLQ